VHDSGDSVDKNAACLKRGDLLVAEPQRNLSCQFFIRHF